MLSFIPYIVIFTFVCVLCNLYGWRLEGVMRRQWSSLSDTKNERSFDADDSGWNFSRFLLILQWCIFFGLILFTRMDDEYVEDLREPDLEVVWHLCVCVAAPAIWFYMQWALYNWWSFLFGESSRAAILTRVYKAVYMLASPMSLLVFVCELVGLFSPECSWILLMLIFVIVQIVFISSGIRIFWNGIGTLCFIFLYLCAFKFAPILLLMAKLG